VLVAEDDGVVVAAVDFPRKRREDVIGEAMLEE
jgi:hypothetical protein